ncbi:MAG TPA: LytTR family DNA-binding domain-containing protein [Bacilli bacterium]|mgnify:CR=1 FL=1|nr:LytTR family DNA-binding domain-containing protein [Bacilli bacterium]
MKKIITSVNQEDLIRELGLVMSENSSYVLIEEGQEAIPKAINIVFDPNEIEQTRELLVLAGYYKNIQRKHLIGRLNDDVHILTYDQIMYIEGIDNDTFVTTNKGEYRVKEKLYELENQLASFQFVRVSKSYIVSVMKIAKIKPTFQGKLILVMDNQQKLEVTRHYLPSFKQYLGL